MATLADATLNEEERAAIARLIELLRDEYGERLVAAWLYGSRARGEAPHPESDVDLLVIVRDGSFPEQDRALELAFQAADETGASGAYFSVQAGSPEWVEERRAIEDFFFQEVDRDKIVLYGGP